MDSQDIYVNRSSRLLYSNRPSPLARMGVARGFEYDISSGTVKWVGGIEDQFLLPGCVPGASPDECICPDGVHVRPKPTRPELR